MSLLIIFIFGLLVGSFLNAVIYRLHTGESVVKIRSHCPKCGHTLAWYELVPVISFVIQRQRCRACKERISWQYPLVEMATGALFVLLAQSKFQMTNQIPSLNDQLAFLYFLAVASLLIVIFVYDLKHYIIPDNIIYPAIGIAFLHWVISFLDFTHWDLIGHWSLVIGHWQTILSPLVSATVASTIFAVVFFISQGRWLGFGDVKLVFFMGLFLGWPAIAVALFVAFILGGIIGIGLIAAQRKTFKSQVPFGPFLVTGTFIAILWGEKVGKWYLSFFI